MPSISTMVYPAPAYVRVETNWADVSQAVQAAVYRVDCLTGARVPLRPYVCFDGDFMATSCGQGVWWDTEPQLDRCVYYCTQAQDASGAVATMPVPPGVLDTFTRTVVDGWGNATETGQPWTNVGGTSATDYDVTGSVGTHTHTVVNSLHTSVIETGTPNQDLYADFMVNVTAAAGAGQVNQWLLGRYSDVSNYYALILILETTGNLSLAIIKRVTGSLIFITQINNFATHVAGDWWRIRLQVWGTQLRAKAWRRIDPEPDWMLTTIDTSLVSGTLAGFQSRLEVGNTNTLPLVFNFDNFSASEPCNDLVPIEVCSQDLVVPSSGDFRLGDPVRPCHDVTLLFNAPIDPDCVPTQGIFFGNMADESFPANTVVFNPINSRYPITVNRTRAVINSTLTIASKTFPDRDAVRTLNEPGSALLLRGPAQYGINDRYMSVGEVTEVRPLPDHRITPRVITLPHQEVFRPSGPTQGVCGARVDDLCDIYPTWNALAASGLTWADLLRGKASNKTPIPDTVERTWSEVNITYANWTAVNSGNTDWDDLRDGA